MGCAWSDDAVLGQRQEPVNQAAGVRGPQLGALVKYGPEHGLRFRAAPDRDTRSPVPDATRQHPAEPGASRVDE